MAQPGVSFFKRALNDFPVFVIGGSVFFGSGIMAYFAIRRQRKYNKIQRRWKRRYTVIREEDYDPKNQVHPYDRVYPVF